MKLVEKINPWLPKSIKSLRIKDNENIKMRHLIDYNSDLV